MKATREEVFNALNTESEYAHKKWNCSTTTTCGIHSITEWIAYMEDYLKEAKHILAREPKQISDPKALHIMRKVTNMGVEAMCQNGAPIREVS